MRNSRQGGILAVVVLTAFAGCDGEKGGSDDTTTAEDTVEEVAGDVLADVVDDPAEEAGDVLDVSAEDVSGEEPFLGERECTDSEDNDGDTMVDCEDEDCTYAADVPGACVNEADLSIERMMNYDMEWNACVVYESCFIDEDCNTACFQENTGLSEGCARCFAQMVSCIVTNCATPCSGGGGSPECFECMGTECGPGYEECHGTLACPYEFACLDHFDNDGDTLVDSEDDDCP